MSGLNYGHPVVDLFAYIYIFIIGILIFQKIRTFKIRANVINTMEQGTNKQTNKKTAFEREFIYKLTVLRNYTCLR